MPDRPSTIVFVEGASDRAALLKLAERRGRDLGAEGVHVVAIGGAHALPRFLVSVPGAKLVGLCDAGEARQFTRALEHVYVCDPDLEDELIRAVGPQRLQEIIDAQGELHSFRTLQKQPAQRARTIEQQLRVFLGNRKIRYAELLVGELDLTNVPRPLDELLEALGAPPGSPPPAPVRC
ncbi:MAG TPA: TOPRIM nucleotidyl transferase/hydrolase domain-containing protein [Gaiellaceae bacterium]|nr:TOPRIM nucleotidyl transferase/hydrolase domain-containing protein [Gaiellaceae bacterium]